MKETLKSLSVIHSPSILSFRSKLDFCTKKCLNSNIFGALWLIVVIVVRKLVESIVVDGLFELIIGLECSRMLLANRTLMFCGFTAGIFVSFTLFGVVQEIIFRGKYGSEDGETEIFTYSVAFTALQCIVCSLFAKGYLNDLIAKK